MHFGARGETARLARGLRPALELTNSLKEGSAR